jgi:hypothetical protein
MRDHGDDQDGAVLEPVPSTLGAGKRLFLGGGEKQTLKLVERKPFPSGAMVLT